VARPLPRTTPIYQLKVTLKDTKPPIWRRLLVPADVTMRRLHDILQIVVGWQGSHLYMFEVGREYIGEPDPEEWREVRPAKTTKLGQAAPAAGAKLVYEYDFGDSWRHDILVEKVLPAQSGANYPLCIAGRRASPPEDCGGAWAYAELLEVIANPAHEEFVSTMTWLGGEFDPEVFDVAETNTVLRIAGFVRSVGDATATPPRAEPAQTRRHLLLSR
jgi:hypothetical protein